MVIKVKHKQGRHYATIGSLIKVYLLSLLKPKKVEIVFDEKSKYNLFSNDNWDWNKVLGRGGLKYKNGARKEEQFIVWRFIPELNQFHVAKYGREDYQMVLPKKWDTIFSKGSVIVDTSNLKSIFPLGGYFGGNMFAPCNLEYKVKIL